MPRLLTLLALGVALAAAAAVPAWPAGPAVDVSYDGERLAVAVREARPLREVIEAIGAATGAETVVRRDPGMVGPLTVGPAPPGVALRQLVGRNSLALTYWRPGEVDERSAVARSGGLRRIILVGRDPRTALPLPESRGEPSHRTPPAQADQADLAAPAEPSDPMRKLLRRVAELGGGQGGESDLLELEEAYYTDQSLELRRAVLVSLSRLNTPAALALIERLGLGDVDPAIRLFAARALHRADPVRSRTALTSAAAAEIDPKVRREIQALLTTR